VGLEYNRLPSGYSGGSNSNRCTGESASKIYLIERGGSNG
jgi:hypothetical protein